VRKEKQRFETLLSKKKQTLLEGVGYEYREDDEQVGRDRGEVE